VYFTVITSLYLNIIRVLVPSVLYCDYKLVFDHYTCAGT